MDKPVICEIINTSKKEVLSITVMNNTIAITVLNKIVIMKRLTLSFILKILILIEFHNLMAKFCLKSKILKQA